MNYSDKDVRRMIIMDHYTNPQNKPLKKTIKSVVKRKSNKSCMDDVIISLLIDNGIILDGSFDGVACAITTASTDILISLVKNKSVTNAKNILIKYEEMVKTGKSNFQNELKEAMIFQSINMQPNRLNCALMPMNLIFEILNG